MSAGYLWVDPVVVAEGDSGTTVATFTVRRAGGSEPFEVNFATADGTALVADSDYVETSGVLSFAAGVDSQTVSVTVRGDTKFELDEYFLLRLSNATNGAVLPMNGSTLGVIANDEKTSGAGNVWIGDSSIVEGDSGTKLMTFVVERAGGTGAFSVNYQTAGNYGDATPYDDYMPQWGVLDFASGETRKTFTVEIMGDTAVEGLERFGVVLSDPTNGAVLHPASGGAAVAWGTILDQDSGGRGVVSISTPLSVIEGDPGTKAVTFTVTRSGGTGAFSVDYATNSDGTDFDGGDGTLTFAAGVDTQTITLLVKGDTVAELDEKFGINLSNATDGAVIRQGSSGLTIVNDDAPQNQAGQIWIDDATVTEGNGETKIATFTISRSNGVLPFSVAYHTTFGGTFSPDPDPEIGIFAPGASPGEDYSTVSGVLQFGAGVMSRTVTVPIYSDIVPEIPESFVLQLSDPTNGAVIMGTATYARDFGTAIILDDDGSIPDSAGHVRIDNVVIVEGGNGTKLATFNVTRSGVLGAFSVDYNTADDGASVVGGDYMATSGTLQFAAGVTSQSVTVAINGDSAVESDELFAVVLTNATNSAVVDKGVGYGRILNDDFPGFAGVVSIGNPAYPNYGIFEGNSGSKTMGFLVTRTAGTGAFSVKYATMDGTATAADGDYVATSGTLNFAEGVDSQFIRVVINGDTHPEANETFSVRLFEPSNGVMLGTSVYSAVIVNDEPTVLVETGASISAMTPAQLAALATQGSRLIDASDDVLSLTAAQWAALRGDPDSYADDISLTAADDVTLKDTGAQLATLSAAAFGAMLNNIDTLDVSDKVVTLGMEQAVFLEPTLASGDVVNVRDSGEAIANWAAVTFAQLAEKSAGSFDAMDDVLTLSVDQYKSLGRRTLTGADTVTLQVANDLDQLTSAELAGLAKKRVDIISSYFPYLFISVAQYKELGRVVIEAKTHVTLFDLGTELSALTPSAIRQLAGKGVDTIQAWDGTMALSHSQLTSLGTVSLYKDSTVILKDTANFLSGLSSSALSELADKGVDIIDATGNRLKLTSEQFAALGTVTVSASDALAVTGTGSSDSFEFAGRRLAATDRIAGGGGTDTLTLRGNYSAGLVLEAATIRSIEQLTVAAGYNYNLQTADENIKTGKTLTVDASRLGSSDALIFDGSAETNGRFNFIGGGGSSTVTGGTGADTITGGSGQDIIRYTSAPQSTGAAYDIVLAFDAYRDHFQTWTGVTAVNPRHFKGELSTSTFDANLTTAMAGLFAGNAALFTANSGELAGETFLVVNTNHVKGYQSGADLVVRLQDAANMQWFGTQTFI